MEKVNGNPNNMNGNRNAAVETHFVSEDSRMRAVSASAQWSKVEETQWAESSNFHLDKLDLLKKKKNGKVFDNADIIVMSSRDGPKTDCEYESAVRLMQNIAQLQGHIEGNADIINMSFSEQSQIDFELELLCDEVDESDTDVDVEDLSTPSPTPSPPPPPPVDLEPLWTEGPIVLKLLETHDQPDDVLRQLDLLHRLLPEYKYYDVDFFDKE